MCVDKMSNSGVQQNNFICFSIPLTPPTAAPMIIPRNAQSIDGEELVDAAGKD